MKLSKLAPLIIIIALAGLLFLVKKCNQDPEISQIPTTSKTSKRGLNRYPNEIKYSKHAMCRMSCRDITKNEVKEVLQQGKINYKKSDLNVDDCKKRYAVESIVNDQNLRIIFAPCGNKVTVVTCIDIDKEWACDCPGDR